MAKFLYTDNMATTIQNHDFFTVVYATQRVFPFAAIIFVFLLVLKVGVWCWNYAKERRSARFLKWFGNHDQDLVDSLVDVGAVDFLGEAIPRGNGIRGWRRVRRSAITEIAFSLADEAYLQFGRRDKSKANDLVTRKFLRDLLSKYDSLRAKDRSRIIEVALTLSYVPPQEGADMEELESTSAYAKLVPSSKGGFF